MSGFGGFGTGSTGGAFFGSKPPEQTSSGFTIPVTTTTTTTSFGTPTFGTGGTSLFGSQQPTPTFTGGFGAKPGSTGTGFSFNTPTSNAAPPTLGSNIANTTAPTFGFTPSTTASALGSSTANTTLPTFGSFGTTNVSTPGTTLNLNVTKSGGVGGFSFPTSNTTTTSTFNFGLTTPATTSNFLTFGVPTTAASTGTAVTSSTPTLTFGVSTTGTTSASVQPTGFTLSQPTTTTSLTSGVPKTTKGLTFGTVTSGFNTIATTAGPASFNLGTGLFGTPKTSEPCTTSAGLGGIDTKQTTQGLSGTGTLEPKQIKDYSLPEPILQTLNEFQNFTKQQKSLSVEISHGSSKPLKKVQEDTEAMESLLTMITSGLTRNAIAVDKLKTETAQGLHQAEMAQRNHETPPGLDYDNSAPADYFNDLVTKFEADTVRLRVQIEASEKHLRSLTQSSTISPQELTLAMRRLHETLIVLAARVQALHTSVQSQKEQFKNFRRVYFKDDPNVIDNPEQNMVRKQTIYSLRSLTGPTPFSENPGPGASLNVDGIAILASSAGPLISGASNNPSWMSPQLETANTSSLLGTSNLFSCMQPLQLPGFQLSKPPTGNKRSRH